MLTQEFSLSSKSSLAGVKERKVEKNKNLVVTMLESSLRSLMMQRSTEQT